MPPRRTKIFLFDIDGTLLSSGGAGYKAFNEIFKTRHNVNYVTEGFSAGGMTDDLIIRELFWRAKGRYPDLNEISEIREWYIRIFPLYYAQSQKIRIMPKAIETVTALAKQDDVSLGLATGNYKITAYEKIRKIGLDHHFTYGGFGCDSELRENLTAKALERALEQIGTTPEAVFVVGDTTRDIECARHIGAKSIAVATGSHSKDVLKQAEPDYLLTDFSEFPSC